MTETTKKMTQVQALENAVAMFERYAETDDDRDTLAVLQNMVEKRKNTPRKPRVNKEAEEFRATLVEHMREAAKPMTNAELAEALAVKPQKVANNIRVLEKAGKIVRKRGEKASVKDTFVLSELVD